MWLKGCDWMTECSPCLLMFSLIDWFYSVFILGSDFLSTKLQYKEVGSWGQLLFFTAVVSWRALWNHSRLVWGPQEPVSTVSGISFHRETDVLKMLIIAPQQTNKQKKRTTGVLGLWHKHVAHHSELHMYHKAGKMLNFCFFFNILPTK